MKEYSIDLDIIKQIFTCSGVDRVEWRLSGSGRGFHFIWSCHKRSCKACTEMERLLDDKKRYAHDLRRPKHHRRILWGNKGGRKAGPWKSVQKH